MVEMVPTRQIDELSVLLLEASCLAQRGRPAEGLVLLQRGSRAAELYTSVWAGELCDLWQRSIDRYQQQFLVPPGHTIA